MKEKNTRKKIEAYIPDQKYQARKRNKKDFPFDHEKFIYDESTDEFICPSGKKLYYIGKAAAEVKRDLEYIVAKIVRVVDILERLRKEGEQLKF